MASKQELQVQQKRQVEDKEEATIPVRQFLPNTDIYETETALTVVLEMPGVEKTMSRWQLKAEFSKSIGESTFPNTRVCSPSTQSTTSVTMREAFVCRARSTRPKSKRR